jgi:uncharacterized protein (DUF1499 family)
MSPRAKRLVIGLAAALAAPVIMFKWMSLTGRPPERPETVAALPGCPASPNCVSSQNADAEHTIAPLKLAGDPAGEWSALREVIQALGGELKRGDARYLHFEFRSRIFGFVDDVECLLNETAGQVEIRSASRVGYSDLGVNRRRVEAIRAALAERQTARETP